MVKVKKFSKNSALINTKVQNDWSKDDNKFGQKYLEKMGWKKGEGIGAKRQGPTENIRVKFKDDTKGLGFKIQDDDKWQKVEHRFSELLSTLQNESDMQIESPSNNIEDKPSLEDRSKKLKSRVHYQKFARGKDITRYSGKDLSCIFGVLPDDIRFRGNIESTFPTTMANGKEEYSFSENDSEGNSEKSGALNENFHDGFPEGGKKKKKCEKRRGKSEVENDFRKTKKNLEKDRVEVKENNNSDVISMEKRDFSSLEYGDQVSLEKSLVCDDGLKDDSLSYLSESEQEKNKFNNESENPNSRNSFENNKKKKGISKKKSGTQAMFVESHNDSFVEDKNPDFLKNSSVSDIAFDHNSLNSFGNMKKKGKSRKNRESEGMFVEGQKDSFVEHASAVVLEKNSVSDNASYNITLNHVSENQKKKGKSEKNQESGGMFVEGQKESFVEHENPVDFEKSSVSDHITRNHVSENQKKKGKSKKNQESEGMLVEGQKESFVDHENPVDLEKSSVSNHITGNLVSENQKKKGKSKKNQESEGMLVEGQKESFVEHENPVDLEKNSISDNALHHIIRNNISENQKKKGKSKKNRETEAIFVEGQIDSFLKPTKRENSIDLKNSAIADDASNQNTLNHVFESQKKTEKSKKIRDKSNRGNACKEMLEEIQNDHSSCGKNSAILEKKFTNEIASNDEVHSNFSSESEKIKKIRDKSKLGKIELKIHSDNENEGVDISVQENVDHPRRKRKREEKPSQKYSENGEFSSTKIENSRKKKKLTEHLKLENSSENDDVAKLTDDKCETTSSSKNASLKTKTFLDESNLKNDEVFQTIKNFEANKERLLAEMRRKLKAGEGQVRQESMREKIGFKIKLLRLLNENPDFIQFSGSNFGTIKGYGNW